MATPLEISIALHYHCKTGDYGKGSGDNNFTASAVQEALERLVAFGVLRRNPPDDPFRYHATKYLSDWISALCAVPYAEMNKATPRNESLSANYRASLESLMSAGNTPGRMVWVEPEEVLALNQGEFRRAVANGTVEVRPDGSWHCPAFPTARVQLNG